MKTKTFILVTLIMAIASFEAKAQTPTLSWVKQFGGTDEDKGQVVSVDPSGNVYTLGTFTGVQDFDPGTGVSNITSV